MWALHSTAAQMGEFKHVSVNQQCSNRDCYRLIAWQMKHCIFSVLLLRGACSLRVGGQLLDILILIVFAESLSGPMTVRISDQFLIVLTAPVLVLHI